MQASFWWALKQAHRLHHSKSVWAQTFCLFQLLWGGNGRRHRDDHADHLLQPGAARPVHRQAASRGHGQPHAQADALQVCELFAETLYFQSEMEMQLCVTVVLCVGAGIRVTLVPLWSWVEWTVTDLISTVSTLTAPLISFLMSPWVSPSSSNSLTRWSSAAAAAAWGLISDQSWVLSLQAPAPWLPWPCLKIVTRRAWRWVIAPRTSLVFIFFPHDRLEL